MNNQLAPTPHIANGGQSKLLITAFQGQLSATWTSERAELRHMSIRENVGNNCTSILVTEIS